jgi:hypothetical protein
MAAVWSLQQYLQRAGAAVTTVDVSGSSAMQTFVEAPGPLLAMLKKFVLNDGTTRIATLVMDDCALHDYDADALGTALRDERCTLRELYLRGNYISSEGLDRLKKAVKYNHRITTIEVDRNPCSNARELSTEGAATLALMKQRLDSNRRHLARP